MTETLLRDRVELERARDRQADINRLGLIETAAAVLKTRFEAFLEAWRDGAVNEDDLKDLERTMEAEMTKQLGHICAHFDSKTEQQSKDILGKVEMLLGRYQAQVTTDQLAQSNALLEAQRRTRIEIIRYGIGFALTVLSALVIFWLTRNG